MINRGNNTKRDFDKMAGDLLDEIHEASALVDLEGRSIGWAPEDAIPILAKALRDATELMDWQPIETAPRDATIIIISTKSGRVMEAQWHIRYESDRKGWWANRHNMDMVIPEHATRWMPLPAPPAIDAAVTPASEAEK